jgi:hypothetical protein
MSHYVVSFRGGTSGRFIANLVWMMIQDLPFNLTFTPENSAHEHNPWCVTWNSVIGAEHNAKEVYHNWRFAVPDNGLFISHTYPNFKVINERMPDLRVIIITFSKDDLLEVATNMIHKNLLPTFKNFVIHNDKELLFKKVPKKEYDMYYIAYVKMYGKPMRNTPELCSNREFIDTMVYLKYDTQLENYRSHEFFEDSGIVVNKNSLVIKFADIFKQEDDSFVALNQLRKFLDINVSEETTQAVNTAYTQYVNNRTEFLKNNLPIETYEDFQIRKNATLVPRHGRSPS